MTESARARTRRSATVLCVSAAAWILLLASPGLMAIHPARPAHHTGMSPTPSLSTLALGWGCMLVAMMAPSLIPPIRHVLERSFRRRRARAVTLFVFGYAAVWMALGSVLLAGVVGMSVVVPHYLAAAAVGLVAAVWQCSPVKQRCLNRGHRHRALSAFGAAADLDALRFGVTHGVWCGGSCWALMLLPFLLPHGHLAVMAVVTLVIVDERLGQPRPPGWRLRVPGKLMRIALAQTKIRLRPVSSVGC